MPVEMSEALLKLIRKTPPYVMTHNRKVTEALLAQMCPEKGDLRKMLLKGYKETGFPPVVGIPLEDFDRIAIILLVGLEAIANVLGESTDDVRKN